MVVVLLMLRRMFSLSAIVVTVVCVVGNFSWDFRSRIGRFCSEILVCKAFSMVPVRVVADDLK